MKMKGKSITELHEGQTADFTKTITNAEILAFATLSGDYNPLHIDPSAAAEGVFGGIIAHGMLVAGLISTAIGTGLPGPGTIYLKQSLRFTKPVRSGDTIRARVEVISLDPVKNRATLSTICSNQRREVVLEGEAVVIPPKAVQ